MMRERIEASTKPFDDDDEPAQIGAMRAMIDYLIPQARSVSPLAAMHLALARTELDVALAAFEGRISVLRPH